MRTRIPNSENRKDLELSQSHPAVHQIKEDGKEREREREREIEREREGGGGAKTGKS